MIITFIIHYYYAIILYTQIIIFSLCSCFFSAENLAEFKELRKRCNMFFMQFVSELVFEGNRSPSEEVVNWLLDCLTYNQGTRQFSVFRVSDVIDPTPVLRSFLLKLLLRAENATSVQCYLQRCIPRLVENFNELTLDTILLLINILQVIKRVYVLITICADEGEDVFTRLTLRTG